MKRYTIMSIVLFFMWAAPVLAIDSELELSLKEAALTGDANAQYELAELYYEKAVDDGNMFELSPVPREKAIKWFEAASKQGHKAAQYSLLSQVYSYANEESRVKWFKLVSTMAANDKYAQYLLGQHFYIGCTANYAGAREQCSKAAHWYTALLEGTEEQEDTEDIVSRFLTYSRDVTVGDMKAHLKDAKKRINDPATGTSKPYDRTKTRIYAEEKIFKTLMGQFGTDPETVRYETRFREDLGADDLDLVEFLMALEESCDIVVGDAEWAEVTTVKSAVDLLFEVLNSDN